MPSRSRSQRLSLWVPPIVYMMLIFHLSSESRPLPALTARVWDKLLHLIEYGGLGLLLCRALLGEGLGWLAALLAAIALTSIYGATDEWHQMFTPLRTADVHDWVADTLGGMVGVATYAAGLFGWTQTRRS
jgi:VanZ family protein